MLPQRQPLVPEVMISEGKSLGNSMKLRKQETPKNPWCAWLRFDKQPKFFWPRLNARFVYCPHLVVANQSAVVFFARKSGTCVTFNSSGDCGKCFNGFLFCSCDCVWKLSREESVHRLESHTEMTQSIPNENTRQALCVWNIVHEYPRGEAARSAPGRCFTFNKPPYKVVF